MAFKTASIIPELCGEHHASSTASHAKICNVQGSSNVYITASLDGMSGTALVPVFGQACIRNEPIKPQWQKQIKHCWSSSVKWRCNDIVRRL